jgi:hypothetical protein
MPDFSRYAGYASGGKKNASWEAFKEALTPKKGSFRATARRIGYFVIFYVVTIAATVLSFAFMGILSIAIPIVMIPVAAFMAFRMAQAAAKAEEAND